MTNCQVASNLVWMIAKRGPQIIVGVGVVVMLARALAPAGSPI